MNFKEVIRRVGRDALLYFYRGDLKKMWGVIKNHNRTFKYIIKAQDGQSTVITTVLDSQEAVLNILEEQRVMLTNVMKNLGISKEPKPKKETRYIQ